MARSLKYYKQAEARLRRARERQILAHERFDDLPNRYPRDIYWNYW